MLVPTERVSEIKRGKKTETTRKFFPGYLIVNMHLLDENNQLVGRTWYFIRETTGRDRLCRHQGQADPDAAIGSRQHARADARARRKGEAEGQLRSRRNVKVADGPFQNQSGIVEEIDPERGKLRVSVTIFGRDTPVELEYWQVERGYRVSDSEFRFQERFSEPSTRNSETFTNMAKEIVAHIKLQIPAGQANPAPPVGPALGQHGVNIMAFCKEFNAATQKQAGDILPVVITVYKDKSFTFITKSPPAAILLEEGGEHRRRLEGAEQDQGRQTDAETGHGHRENERKDLNARNDEAGFRIIAGTARQMGLEIVD